MERNGSILIAAVSAGILVAGAVATVAIVQASQAVPEPQAVTLVVDPSAAGVDPSASGPSFEPGTLPEIVLPSPSPTANASEPANAAESFAPLDAPAAEPATAISSRKARSLVLAEAPGTLLSVVETTRAGFDAFAVNVERSDGSTVTGYVSKADGIIFDWTQTAAPTSVQGYADDDDTHSGDSEGADHDGDDD